MNVELYIDELVLDGFDPSERYRIGDALEAELRKLLLKGDLPAAVSSARQTNFEYDSVDANPIQLESNPSSRSVGGEVAGALHGALRERLSEGSKGSGE